MTRNGCAAGLLLLLTYGAGLAPGQVEDEEFVGPFSSWSNVNRSYGSDFRALQKALDEVGTSGHPSSVFLEAGTYCVEQLSIVSRIGITILGADPATTIVKYCGAARGVMLRLDGVAYSRIGRLTFDCEGVASVAIDQAWDKSHPHFDTGNEYSDLIFRNCPTAIRGGDLGSGFAETTVMRARFGPSSGTCVLLRNFNALDLWIWYSDFDGCRIAVSNQPGAGNFGVYNSIFRRSVVADLAIGNTGGFNIRNNTSIESNAFWTTSSSTNPAQINLQGNKLIRVAQPAVVIRNQGPALLVDNRFESRPNESQPAISATAQADTDLLTAGNVFTTRSPVVARGRFTAIDDVVTSSLKLQIPELPETPRARHRRVFEAPKDASGKQIQELIRAAARSGAPRSIVHIPEGRYRVDITLEVPRGADIQIVGDGFIATELAWSGSGAGPVFHVAGPSKVIFRELRVSAAKKAEGILADGLDQPGARVYLQQTQVSGSSTAGLFVDGLDHTLVDLRNSGHRDNGPGPGIKVSGGRLAASGHPAGGRTDLFSGASSNNALSYEVGNGGRLLVRDIWYESNSPGVYVRLSGNSRFTEEGSRVALPRLRTPPAADLADFHGVASFLTSAFDDRIVTSGSGAGSRLLILGLVGGVDLPQFLLNQSSPPALAAVLHSRDAVRGGSSVAIANEGRTDPVFLREMLKQTRAEQPGVIAELPAGVSDIRFYRVWTVDTTTGIHLRP